MDVFVQGNLHIGMPQNFAETFDIHSAVNAVCGKGMPQNMEIVIRGIDLFEILLKMILISPRFHWFTVFQDILLLSLSKLVEK